MTTGGYRQRQDGDGAGGQRHNGGLNASPVPRMLFMEQMRAARGWRGP